MTGTMTVELQALRFFAQHGVHDEEIQTGNEFEVDVAASFSTPEQVITDLDETANYVAVYQIVQREMATRQLLLETVAMRICHQLPEVFGAILEATIAIRKLNPPISGFRGRVGVRYTHKF